MSFMDKLQTGLNNISNLLMDYSYQSTMQRAQRRAFYGMGGYGMGLYNSIWNCRGSRYNSFSPYNFSFNNTSTYYPNGLAASLYQGGKGEFLNYMAMNQNTSTGGYNNFMQLSNTALNEFEQQLYNTWNQTNISNANNPANASNANNPANASNANNPANASNANNPANASNANNPANASNANNPANASNANNPTNTSSANDPANASNANDPTNASNANDPTNASNANDPATLPEPLKRPPTYIA